MLLTLKVVFTIPVSGLVKRIDVSMRFRTMLQGETPEGSSLFRIYMTSNSAEIEVELRMYRHSETLFGFVITKV